MENVSKVLIITDEPIFSFGLRVQFKNWGFVMVDIAGNCGLALQNIRKQLPSLIIIDEKLLHAKECTHLVLIANLLTIPLIVLTVHQRRLNSVEGTNEARTNFSYLSKPCQVDDLKAVTEKLLRINILLAKN